MKFSSLIFLFLFNSSLVWAKSPQNPDLYRCKDGAKPEFLSATKEGPVIGICGSKDADETNHFFDFSVQIVGLTVGGKNRTQKSIFSDHSPIKKFLISEKRDGLVLIEKVKVDQEYVEVFRHDLVCTKKTCKMKKEICMILNKVKQKWILENLKDMQIKSRMKKTGC